MQNGESTLVYQSNVFPVLKGSFREDRVFLAQIHDPFSLEFMEKNGYGLNSRQEEEYRRASVHCTYAYEGDYPWGTVTTDDNSTKVTCKCTRIDCSQFQSCRPDFDIKELDVYKENRIARPAIFSVFQNLKGESAPEEKDVAAAISIFSADTSFSGEEPGSDIAEAVTMRQSQETDSDFVIHEAKEVRNETVYKRSKADFSSFEESTQQHIIESNVTERIIVNAGPGTGKTWTLIERLIYLINYGETVAEDILVLCFSRSAVDVVKRRLKSAAERGRIGYEWREIDIRTFDSFATYMLAWVQKEMPDLLPSGFILDGCDYEQRIIHAVSVLEQEKDMLAEYKLIMVDEVQDLVGSRAKLVLSLLRGLPETCGFTLLGDVCQSLYDYLAADNPAIMTSDRFYRRIFESFPSAQYLSLTENYRQGDELGRTSVPYRNAILTGTPHERCSEAEVLFSSISETDVRLCAFTKENAKTYIRNGTLGILTRTNGQALQISAWLRNEDVPHDLNRGLGNTAFGDWISLIFTDWKNETADEASFISQHIALFPDIDYEIAKNRWAALINTHVGELQRRIEVQDLLFGLLRNARDNDLYRSNNMREYAITISNIHRAKGKEFDSVIVIDDVISAMTDTEHDDLLEHKVCYVALTRSKKRIERASLPSQYIYIMPDETRRCSKAGCPRPGKKPYISHFEVGADNDLEQVSFAETIERQEYIRNQLKPGTRLKLKKCPQNAGGYVIYCVVAEDQEHIILGYTSKAFARELNASMQKILKITSDVYYEVFPHAFYDVYVDEIISCISSTSAPPGAKTFGDISIWTGFTIAGFAAVDKDTY